MKMNFKPVNADSLEFELTVKMPLREWKRLQKQLDLSYPAWQLSRAIREMVEQAETQFSNETSLED